MVSKLIIDCDVPVFTNW